MKLIRKKSRLICPILSIILVMLVALSFAIYIVGDNEIAESAVISDADILSTDLLLETRDTNVGGNVFREEALQTLYKKLAGTSATYATVATKARTAKSTFSTTSVKSIHSGMDSADIRTANSGKNIVVTLGGKEWIVMALTTKDQSSNSDVILTLLLKNVAYDTKWSDWVPSSSTNFSQTYPAVMYTSSYVRAGLLNGGNYSISPGSGTKAFVDADRISLYGSVSAYPFSIYTNANATGSITNFIVKPNEVLYQQYENFYDISEDKQTKTTPYTTPNDSAKYDVASNKWHTTGSASTIQSNTNYYSWGNDLLWLPSISEIGHNARDNLYTNGGLWNTNASQRGVSTNKASWLRSTSSNKADQAFYLDSAGMQYYTSATSTSVSYSATIGTLAGTCAVRPAFNLNLTAAQSSSFTALTTPSDVTTTYDGTQQDYFKSNGKTVDWYNVTTFSSANANVKVEYFSESGSTLTAASLKEFGKYKVKLTIQSSKYIWANGSKEKTITYQINKRSLTVKFNSTAKPPTAEPTNLCTADINAGLKDTILRIHYVGQNVEYDDYVEPTKIGKYTASVEINTSVSNNYVLDKTYSTTYEVPKADVSIPVRTGVYEKEYIGDFIEFTLTGGDNDKIVFTLPSEMAWKNDDRATNTLIAKKADKYRVIATLADDGVATQWANGTDRPIYLDYEITPKPLGVTITCSVDDFKWDVGDTPTITITEDSYTEDTVELKVYYINNNIGTGTKYDEINTTKIVNGKTTTITMPGSIAKGDYTVYVELVDASSSNANGNYSLSVPKTLVFHVKGSKVTIDASKLVWLYNTTVITDTSNVKLTYSGSTYQFSVDASVLRTYGAKVDITQGVNGYGGDFIVTNANSNYSVTVFVTNYDNTYESYNAQYTLSYSIDKAKYNLNGLSWNYSLPLAYKTSAQSVTLTGNLPKGLTTTYSGNGNMPVGTYTTTVTFNVSDTENYEIPSRTDSNSYIYDGEAFPFSLNWEIVKAKLTGNWKPGEEADGIYKLPILSTSAGLDLDEMVTYKYYDENGQEVDPIEIDYNKENTYIAVATLTDDYAKCYELSNNTYEFTIGQNRYPVRIHIDIENMQLPYKGSPYDAKIVIDEGHGITVSSIEKKYFDKATGEELQGAPTAVGQYIVQASLTFGLEDNYYIDNNTFEFEIVKADFDTSRLEWQYTHTNKDGDVTIATYDFEQGKWLNTDMTQTGDFTYDGYAHNLVLLNKDNIADLTINYMEGGQYMSAISKINAETYSVTLEFTYAGDCYNAPNFADTLTFTVEQAEIDTSQVVWGYSDGSGEDKHYTEALVFTRRAHIDVEYTLKLINLPEQLIDAISYSGNIASNAGIYTAEYTLDFNDNNYKPVVMSESLASRRWEIKQRLIAKPINNGEWTVFDGKEHSLAQVFGIDEDGWDNYVSITATYNEESYDGYIATNAGDYIVSFTLINAGTNNTNINWVERPAPVNLVEVAQLELNITQWEENGENSKVILEDDDYAVYLDYRYLDKDSNEVNSNDLLPNVEYYKEVIVKSEYLTNVRISQDSVSKISFSFSDGRTKVNRPTFGKLEITYDGNNHTKDDFGMSAIENFIQMEFPSEIKNAGEYKVSFKFKYSGLYCWDDGSDGVYEVTLKILKVQLPPEWNTDGETPTFVIPENFAGLVELQYTYYDSDGNEIALEDMTQGESYKVVAKISEQYANNFEFVDAQGEVLQEATISEEKTFKKSENVKPPINSEDDKNGGGSGGTLDEILAKLKEMPLWQLVSSVISILLTIIFLSKTASYDKKRKKFNRKADKLSTAYAGAYLGVAMTIWTTIACILIGLAVISLIMMLIAKSRCDKAEEEYEDCLEEYNRNQKDLDERKRDENMRMMLMGIMGGSAGASGNGGYVVQQGIGLEDMRGLISETVTAMLPNMQQMLPGQASTNDELVQKFLEKTAKNEDTMQKLMKKIAEQPQERIVEREVASSYVNDEVIKKLVENQELLMKKMAEQSERIVEKEVVATAVNDETIKNLIEGQKAIMQRLVDLSSIQNAQPQIIEKEVPVEKIVEKIVEVPIEVEKIVEKEVVKEVPVEVEKVVEKVIEIPVEKVVEKEVKVEVEKVVSAKLKKEVAPRLTLDEAYANLSKQQKKFFDELRAYALSKPNSKEKKATYAITIGQSTVNPLLKLTIKKDMTVALFKMEDEYLKDIKKDATSDGTKIKVKETEVVISDAQACKAAKNMIDLREDQIERYQDLLKEQRALSKQRK